jgi:hypothetical protein
MWKMQGFGSCRVIGSGSPGSSWMFTVPLNPLGSLLLPPVATAGLDAVKTNRAKPTRKVMTPLALRICFLASCGLDSPVMGLSLPYAGGRACSTEGQARNADAKVDLLNG